MYSTELTPARKASLIKTVVAAFLVATTSLPAASIVVDGELSDWKDVPNLGAGLATSLPGKRGIDLRELKLSSDDHTLYIAYENSVPIELNWGYNLLLDLDETSSTGFRHWDIGADYLVQGGFLYSYTGDGSSWEWQFECVVPAVIRGNVAEIAVPRDRLGNTFSFHCKFIGDNAAFGGSFLEQIPAGLTGDGRTYLRFDYRSGGSNREEISEGITIDGNLDDWPAAANVGGGRALSDRRGNAIDLESLWITNDVGNLYLGYRNKGPVELNWGYSLYVDTDRNPSSGYPLGEIGGDLLIQGANAYLYSGVAGEWAWTYLGTLLSSTSGRNAEICLPRVLFGQIDAFDYVFLGDNHAFGGAEYELVPCSKWEGGTGLFTYHFKGHNPDPKNLNPALDGEVVLEYLFDDLNETADRHDPLTPTGSPILQDGALVFTDILDSAEATLDNNAITDGAVTALAIDFRIRHDAWLGLGVGAAFILDWRAAWDTQMVFVQDKWGVAPAFKAGANIEVAAQTEVDLALSTDHWHDVRMLNTLTGYELWIDGALIASAASPGDLDRWWRRPESTLRLGGFDGALDFVRIIAVRD